MCSTAPTRTAQTGSGPIRTTSPPKAARPLRRRPRSMHQAMAAAMADVGAVAAKPAWVGDKRAIVNRTANHAEPVASSMRLDASALQSGYAQYGVEQRHSRPRSEHAGHAAYDEIIVIGGPKPVQDQHCDDRAENSGGQILRIAQPWALEQAHHGKGGEYAGQQQIGHDWPLDHQTLRPILKRSVKRYRQSRPRHVHA